jgi:hypothetical protein
MIAATAIAEDLPLFTTSSDDFNGLTDLLTIVPVIFTANVVLCSRADDEPADLHLADGRPGVTGLRRTAGRHVVLPGPRRRLDPRNGKAQARRVASTRLVMRHAW